MVPSWDDVEQLLGTTKRLHTIERDKPFDAVVDFDAIKVTPTTGQVRRITRAEFERIARMIVAGQAPGDLQNETFNSSYLESIVNYLRRRR